MKSQGIPFSGSQLISFLHDFSLHFLLKKTKCILQSKETDQFDTQRPTHVVVLIIGFVGKKRQNGFVSEVKCFALKIP